MWDGNRDLKRTLFAFQAYKSFTNVSQGLICLKIYQRNCHSHGWAIWSWPMFFLHFRCIVEILSRSSIESPLLILTCFKTLCFFLVCNMKSMSDYFFNTSKVRWRMKGINAKGASIDCFASPSSLHDLFGLLSFAPFPIRPFWFLRISPFTEGHFFMSWSALTFLSSRSSYCLHFYRFCLLLILLLPALPYHILPLQPLL